MKAHNNCLNLEKSALLSQSRQRYIPTFVHQPIFNYLPVDQKVTRCTPTFHSTALSTDGYNIQTHHKKTQIQRPQTGMQASVYRNNSHQKRVQDLNPHNHVCSSSRQKWYDNTKKQIIDEAKQSSHVGYSRCRKIIDLSSDPVFTQYNYGKNQPDQKQPKIVQLKSSEVNGEKVHSSDVVQKQLPKDTIINHIQNNQQRQEKPAEPCQKIVNKKKDFHQNCVPDYQKNLKLKGKQIPQKVSLKQPKKQLASQKPSFTVVRKNRVRKG